MELLQENAHLVYQAGEEVAQKARALTSLPVEVENGTNTSGRPVSVVRIPHPGGLASQAKHGTLTRAAAQCGLDVKRY
ncbi:hypothetical protein C1Y63_10580 [Corynebacterium sp. 13CS0277]|nr:hypothetical protein C1Y63_10580 [Corynebacterium sp. 13CS0277]